MQLVCLAVDRSFANVEMHYVVCVVLVQNSVGSV